MTTGLVLSLLYLGTSISVCCTLSHTILHPGRIMVYFSALGRSTLEHTLCSGVPVYGGSCPPVFRCYRITVLPVCNRTWTVLWTGLPVLSGNPVQERFKRRVRVDITCCTRLAFRYTGVPVFRYDRSAPGIPGVPVYWYNRTLGPPGSFRYDRTLDRSHGLAVCSRYTGSPGIPGVPV